MNQVQGIGIFERLLYSAFLFLAMKGVAQGWWGADMAAYIAAAALAVVGSARAWWVNRPTSLLSDAAAQLPKNSTLVITTTPAATIVEKKEAVTLANASGDKVTVKTA